MLRITTGHSDEESEFEILIRISIGAGESASIRGALAWGIPERRAEDASENSALDRYWEATNSGIRKDGHALDELLKTKEALQESLFDSPEGSRRRREIERGISLVEKALGLAQATISILASEHVISGLTAE